MLMCSMRYGAASKKIPIIDSHIHLFDPRRPGGIPWPTEKESILYRPALPDRYAKAAARFDIVGAIAIEASPLLRDNDWLLTTAADNSMIVGVVGNLLPGDSAFRVELERLCLNPLFLGIRYGNLWNRNLWIDLNKPGFVDDLKLLAKFGLTLDTANQNLDLIRAAVKVINDVPGLRVVIDHLPNAQTPAGGDKQREYQSLLGELSKSTQVFIKISEVPVLRANKLVTDSRFYADKLDKIWDLFGEDRLIFGSDWPNSDTVASFGDTFSIVKRYMAHKGSAEQGKFFWKNSIAAYRWRPRRRDQPAV